jgi:hypothetical protein
MANIGILEMEPNPTPRAVRYTQSHRAAAPAQVDWRVVNHARNSTLAPQFRDHAFPILHGEPTIDDRQRESLWDLFHSSKDATELAAKLHPMALHPDLKEQLLRAKNRPSVELDATDNVVGAIQKMATLDPKILDLAEQHNHVLQALLAGSE